MENAESLLFVESDTRLPMTEYKKKFKITQVKFALSETQRKELLATAKAHNYKNWLMIFVQLFCGMRVSELVHLTIENVNPTLIENIGNAIQEFSTEIKSNT